MLTVHATGDGGPGVLQQLEHLSAGRLHPVDDPVRAAVSLAVTTRDLAGSAGPEVDVVLVDDGDGADLAEQVTRVWEQRLRPWLVTLDAGRETTAPAVLVAHDRFWAPAAARHLRRVRTALAPLVTLDAEVLPDHIGSTAVPGLVAKAIIDLQVRLPTLPLSPGLDAALVPLGYLPAVGSRPDSPGVHRDTPRGSEDVPDAVWVKRLFFRPDPTQPVILHLRQSASPFGRYTVWFRDWLRAHPEVARRYGQVKTELAVRHAGDEDYDNYTRAKTAHLDEVQGAFESWARSR